MNHNRDMTVSAIMKAEISSPVSFNRYHVASSDAGKISQVDGIGLWNSFTRNFSSPLLAAFDLLDNAFE